jgi:hypothetical protein
MNQSSSAGASNVTIQWTYTGDTVPANGDVVITTTTSNPVNGTFETYFKGFSKDLEAQEGDVRFEPNGETWMFWLGMWRKLYDQFIIEEII